MDRIDIFLTEDAFGGEIHAHVLQVETETVETQIDIKNTEYAPIDYGLFIALLCILSSNRNRL